MMKQFNNLVELLSYRATIEPQKKTYTFLSDGETKELNLTYGDLELQAKAIATQLQSLNLTGERALLLYPPGLDYITAFFGCLYAGVIPIPTYPPRPNRSLSRLLAIINDAQAKIALTTTSAFSKIERKFTEIPELKALYCLKTDTINFDIAQKWQHPIIKSNTLAFLQYTSGSTGSPKGVMVSHKNLLHNLKIIHQAFEHNNQSQGVIWLPPYHDMGLIGGILEPIYSGFPVTLMSPFSFVQKPRRWLEAISKYRATTSGAPNFAYDLCVDKITDAQKTNLDLSSWEVAFNGAEKVRVQTLERFTTAFAPCGFKASAFYPCYGMAEATLFISGGFKDKEPTIINVDSEALKNKKIIHKITNNNSSENKRIHQLVSCGHSWLEQEIIIVDPENLQECSENQIGEIWVRSDSITQGYWNQPELTKKNFEAILREKRDKKFFRTEDLGFLNNGELYITGRMKDLIIINGRNHYSQDIELTVEKSHVSIITNSCAAISIDMDGEEKLVVLAEVKCPPKEGSEEICKSICTNIATIHEIQVESINLFKQGTIPKTSSGKIQRFLCHQLISN